MSEFATEVRFAGVDVASVGAVVIVGEVEARLGDRFVGRGRGRGFDVDASAGAGVERRHLVGGACGYFGGEEVDAVAGGSGGVVLCIGMEDEL